MKMNRDFLMFLPVIACITIIPGCGGDGDESGLLPPGRQTTHLETFRPQLHYTPQAGWMNDPNGLIWHDGTWNLYHQFIDGDYVIDRMDWGHATSKDLIRWTYRPVAISTNPELGMAYSGSAISDPGNVSGLCDGDPADCILAYFTHSLMLGGDQKQSLAASSDGGMTFVEYDGNPIMPNPGMTHFRDPKVFLYEGEQAVRAGLARDETDTARGPAAEHWNMVLAQGRQIGIYISGDMIEWQPASTIDNVETWDGGVWECPDLFPMPVENDADSVKWVLMVSTFDGAPWGGSGVMYFTGDFDGHVFTPDDPTLGPKWLDHGWDFYAAQTFADVPASDGRSVLVAWMNNWKYALGIPAMPWQGSMAIPRQLALEKDLDGTFAMKQAPVDEFVKLRRGRVTALTEFQTDTNQTVLYSSESGTYEIDIAAPAEDNWNLRIECLPATNLSDAMSGDAEPVLPDASLTVGVDQRSIFIDRSDAICDECPKTMPTFESAVIDMANDPAELDVRIIVDHSGIEIFANRGRTTMTALAFLPGPLWRIGIETPDADKNEPVVFNKIDIYELMSIWAEPETE